GRPPRLERDPPRGPSATGRTCRQVRAARRDRRWQAGRVNAADLVAALTRSGTGRGDPVALALDPVVGIGVATAAGSWSSAGADASRAVAALEHAFRPRWVLWSNETAVTLVKANVRVATAWDVAAVHRLLFGGWAADPGRVWAATHGLAPDTIPTGAPPDLFTSLERDAG